MGSKGQLPLDFFESVGICDGAQSNVFQFLFCFHAQLFIDALKSPGGKGLTSWLSFVMSNCDVCLFDLILYSINNLSVKQGRVFLG